MYSQIKNISIACIILIALGGVFQKATAATEEEMRAAMQGMLDALNVQDAAQMSSYWTDNIVYDFVAQPPPMEGKEAVAAFFGALFEGAPDFHSTQTRILVSGNIMVTEALATGTHLGELSGIPATGNSFQLAPLHIWEFEGDKVKRATEYLDMASMLMQIGLMPAPALDPALLIPSFPLPDPEPTGLAPLEAAAEMISRYNSCDLSGLSKMIHPDANILVAPLGIPLSRSAYIAVGEMMFQGFSKMPGEIVRAIDMGDGWVVTELLITGTNDGPYMGMPATRRSIALRGVSLQRYNADGLLTDLASYYDTLTMLAQLGLFPPPDPEANKAVQRRALEEVFNQGNLDVVGELFNTDLVYHIAGFPDVQGTEGVKQVATMFRTAFPDLQFTIEEQIAEADKLALRWTATGTHNGEFMGLPPTGNQMTVTGISFVRFADGKFAEEWSVYDTLGMMEQLGAAPVTHTDYTWGAPSEVTGEPGEKMTNTALVLYIVEKFWNQKNVSVLGETHSSDSIAHNPIIPGHPLPFDFYKQACLLHIAAFPDLKVTTDDIIAEGDKVVIRWTVTGTHQGELMGIPASGRQVTWPGFTIYRFADGKIVENWWAYDAMGMMQQITGPLPVPEDLVVDQITSPSLESNPLGDPATRNIVIYLPPGYETSDKGYPVVYLMPGLGATERWWACGEFSPAFSLMGIAVQNLPEAGFASMIDSLIADGKIRPMIIVMPDMSTAYGGSFCVNSALNGNHEDYIVNDIVPYIDANYRTLPSRDSRGIAGHCMGGYAAIYLSMRHPDVFGAVASHSGTLLTAGLLPDMQPVIAAENPEGLTLTGPDPAKPWTSTLYVFSAAFSPNLDNPPFYVDIPFDENVQLREDIAQVWASYDLLQIFPDYVSALANLKGIYLDAGDKDELNEQLIAQAFSGALSAAGIEHQLEIFDGAHMDNLYTRLAVSLGYLSDALGD